MTEAAICDRAALQTNLSRLHIGKETSISIGGNQVEQSYLNCSKDTTGPASQLCQNIDMQASEKDL